MAFRRSYTKALRAALLLPFCCVSCLSQHDTALTHVNPKGWDTPAVIPYDNTDTVTLKEAALVLRYGPEASPDNGTYIVEARSPSGARTRDTLRIPITFDQSANNLREMRYPFRTKVRLAEEGEYIFTVTPQQENHDIWSVAIDFKNNH